MKQEIIKRIVMSTILDDAYSKAKLTILFCGALSALTEFISDLINYASMKILSPIVWGAMLCIMWGKLVYDLGIPFLRNIFRVLISLVISGISAYVLHVLFVSIYIYFKLLLFQLEILDNMEIIIDTILFDPFLRFITIYLAGILFIKLITRVFKMQQ